VPKIVEVEILDLRKVQRRGQRSPNVAPVKGRIAFAVEDDINRLCARGALTFQEIKHGRVHQDRPSLAVF
jgi:hypothetical protein